MSRMPKYFDIHSHLNHRDYDSDRDEVMGRLRDRETHTIVVGTNLESSKRAVELAEAHDEIYACIGVHPVDDPIQIFETDQFSGLVVHPKVVSIGECGMDFYHVAKSNDYERQKTLFLAQIDFAITHDKPLMIHARNAYDEILEILTPLKSKYGDKLRGNIHFFAGDLAHAEKFLDLGFTLSFTGVITFVRDYDEVIKTAPIDMIMAETDSPYVSPVPYRGSRNEPAYVSEVVKKIALIRGEDLELVRETLVKNALRMVM